MGLGYFQVATRLLANLLGRPEGDHRELFDTPLSQLHTALLLPSDWRITGIYSADHFADSLAFYAIYVTGARLPDPTLDGRVAQISPVYERDPVAGELRLVRLDVHQPVDLWFSKGAALRVRRGGEPATLREWVTLLAPKTSLREALANAALGHREFFETLPLDSVACADELRAIIADYFAIRARTIIPPAAE